MSDFRQELLAVFAAELKEHLAAIRAVLEGASAGQRPELRDAFRRAHTLKGAGRAVDLPVVEAIAHRLETLFAAVEAGGRALDGATIDAVQRALDAIEAQSAAPGDAAGPPAQEALAGLDRLLGAPAEAPPPPPAPAVAPAEPPPVAGAPAEYLRITAGQVDRLSDAVHLLATEYGRQETVTGRLRGVQSDAQALGRQWEELRRRLGALPGADGLASGLAGFEQALRALERRTAALARGQRGAGWSLGQAAQQVREATAQLSLVPASEVLGPLGRMARDIAREEGREVTVRLEGLELQAERRVLQALKDPVLHMLRNAISHGVEPPAERAARGKPPQAEVGLRLAPSGGRLVVTVHDDGRGPDLARIEAVAASRGLLAPRPPGEPPPPSDQLLRLVFEPGFSTAAAVDRLSGRGMGLSVVAEAARRLRGSAVLRPRRPHGAEIEIAVPFSASLQTLLLLEAGGETLALPGHGVDRLIRLRTDALDQVEGQPVIRIAGRGGDVVAPVLALSTLLGFHASALPVVAGHVQLVLLRRGNRHCALAVEACRDVRTLPVGDLDTPGMDAALVAGGTLLDDDTPVLVLNPDGLLDRWLRDESRLAASGVGLAVPATAAPPQRTILVVDDSITTRTLERSILEAQGYRVLLSVDGVDALGVLRGAGAAVDLVVADVEMPRMDGFALLQAMKTDPRLAPIPVILMTSRADPADIRRGLDLGAGAYVTKQKFDQRELLATIGQML
ncbi:response regulator [Belnapia sp. T6]|uniref:histidine kinase n=1 Tax=Belnapia mucosa TaxID=2804532 RepID=A0ABS1V1Z5_9PROT|nr:response regulator [Belnapia mucosa]MBL6455717.1 response regulator [Belnapia mucosa]